MKWEVMVNAFFGALFENGLYSNPCLKIHNNYLKQRRLNEEGRIDRRRKIPSKTRKLLFLS